MNVGSLVDPFALAYDILFIVVFADTRFFFLLVRPLFIVHMTFILCFEYVLGYLN